MDTTVIMVIAVTMLAVCNLELATQINWNGVYFMTRNDFGWKEFFRQKILTSECPTYHDVS